MYFFYYLINSITLKLEKEILKMFQIIYAKIYIRLWNEQYIPLNLQKYSINLLNLS